MTAAHVPPPAGLAPPFRWGDEEGVAKLLGAGVSSLQATRRDFVFRHPSAADFVAWMGRWYGPTHAAFSKLDHEGRAAFEADLVALAEEHNRADDGTFVCPSTYLEVTAVVA